MVCGANGRLNARRITRCRSPSSEISQRLNMLNNSNSDGLTRAGRKLALWRIRRALVWRQPIWPEPRRTLCGSARPAGEKSPSTSSWSPAGPVSAAATLVSTPQAFAVSAWAFFTTTAIVSCRASVGLNSIVSVPGSAAGVCPGGA